MSGSDGATALAVCRSWVMRSYRCLHTRWRGRATRSIFDHRETVMGLCRLSRTVCERVGDRWRDGAGSLLTLGYRVIPMHAPVLARAVDAADFRPSRNGDGTVPAGAHSLRVWESDGATARAVCRPSVSGHTDACTHVGAGGRWDRFSTIEKR